MQINLIKYPMDEDWIMVKKCALTTIGKSSITLPTSEWKESVLLARHSPIRELNFIYEIKDIPYWVTVHLVRHHIGINFYIKSQRNDRQDKYDRDAARQDAPVDMIISVNAEELITIANKRLCNKASAKTREVVQEMCRLAIGSVPELESSLVPMCVRNGNICYEMFGCGKCSKFGGNRLL